MTRDTFRLAALTMIANTGCPGTNFENDGGLPDLSVASDLTVSAPAWVVAVDGGTSGE
jgi:hypothetical protein